MSGFLAVRSANGPVNERAVATMLRAGGHRGIARTWSEDGIALAAFDGRQGSGLAVAEDFVVACDARIDNRDGNAAEVLLRARRIHELPKLIGDFAGAVWDRSTKQLHVFRDPTGCRGALLGRSTTGDIAASSLPMLLADPGLDKEIDGEWVRRYLSGEGGFERVTGYRNIERLEPGSLATPGWKQTRYFEWSFAPVRERDDAAYAERLAELLTEATRARIAGATKIGVSLSGGMDSTSVAAFARQARPDADLTALCVPFTDAAGDERALQEQVARHLGMTLRWAPLLNGPFGVTPQDTIEMLGTPPVAPNQFFIDAVADAGRDEGIEVALDGIDGDGLLGGNWYYLADLFATLRWRSFSEELTHAARRHRVGRARIFKAAVASPIKRSPGRIGRIFASEERQSMSPGVLPIVLETIEEQWARRGIEVAHPFLDRRVVEFCLGLPRKQKIRNGLAKIVLRNATRKALPASVTERAEKAELGSTLLSSLNREIFHTVETGLLLEASNPSPWVPSEDVMALAERFRRGSDSVQAYRLAFVGYWRDQLQGTDNRQAGVSSSGDGSR